MKEIGINILISHQTPEGSAKELNKTRLPSLPVKICIIVAPPFSATDSCAQSHCSYLNGGPVAIAICCAVKGHRGRFWLGKAPFRRHMNKQKWQKNGVWKTFRSRRSEILRFLNNLHFSLGEMRNLWHILAILQDLTSILYLNCFNGLLSWPHNYYVQPIVIDWHQLSGVNMMIIQPFRQQTGGPSHLRINHFSQPINTLSEGLITTAAPLLRKQSHTPPARFSISTRVALNINLKHF